MPTRGNPIFCICSEFPKMRDIVPAHHDSLDKCIEDLNLLVQATLRPLQQLRPHQDQRGNESNTAGSKNGINHESNVTNEGSESPCENPRRDDEFENETKSYPKTTVYQRRRGSRQTRAGAQRPTSAKRFLSLKSVKSFKSLKSPSPSRFSPVLSSSAS